MALKEHGYLAFALVASSCAGYGAMAAAWRLIGFEGSVVPLVGLGLGLGALALMVRGISAIRAERLRRRFANQL